MSVHLPTCSLGAPAGRPGLTRSLHCGFTAGPLPPIPAPALAPALAPPEPPVMLPAFPPPGPLLPPTPPTTVDEPPWPCAPEPSEPPTPATLVEAAPLAPSPACPAPSEPLTASALHAERSRPRMTAVLMGSKVARRPPRECILAGFYVYPPGE